MSDTRDEWTKDVGRHLVGKKITHVRYLSKKEMKKYIWCKNPIVIFLDDGNWIMPVQDDECNDGGSMATSFGNLTMIPVIGEED
mgnify:CR=1 FL=1|tara:strand:+ start:6216 stop:6467 length:252 start_codon:yes stop_codon:yes gene_type:complete